MKKINSIDIPSSLEKHFRMREINPVDKFEYRGYTVYLAEGGPYGIGVADKYFDPDFPNGYYESVYAVQEGDRLFYMPIQFEYFHDISSLTVESRRKGRINTAKKMAMQHLDAAIKELH